MNGFTPVAAAIGGALIGLAAVLLWLLNGRVAGISGIAGGLWFSTQQERRWRLLFLAGLVLGAGLWALLAGAPAVRPRFPAGLLMLAGLLVGFGTSLAGGCTSGHGVCGVARGSSRSFVATIVFLAVALATTGVVRHVLATR
ncbi:MAG TPA: YeeE/YedE thiosulfate transporter family protein [Burkholderiaceae bacterium]|nr:YeeE/YedE thiosulfate transporter family protein [Burkholderiaceae bacterium]